MSFQQKHFQIKFLLLRKISLKSGLNLPKGLEGIKGLKLYPGPQLRPQNTPPPQKKKKKKIPTCGIRRFFADSVRKGF